MAPALLLSAFVLPSCEESPAFSSTDLANNSLPPNMTKYDPVLVKAADGTMICIVQGEYDFQFFKSAEGYGETGYDAGIDIKAVKLAGAVDYSQSDLYHPITPLDALALVHYDWGKIFTSAVHQANLGQNPIDAIELGKALEWLSTGNLNYTAPGNTDYRPGWYWEQSEAISGLSSEWRNFAIVPVEIDKSPWRFPVVFCLPNNCLLRVVEENTDARRIHFFKNAAGYGVQGARANLLIVGAGHESPTANTYSEISLQEVFAHFDGELKPLLERAIIQARHISQSVNPERLANLFGYTIDGAPSSSAPEIRKRTKEDLVREELERDLEAAFLNAAHKDKTGLLLQRWNELDEPGRLRLMNAWAVAQQMEASK